MYHENGELTFSETMGIFGDLTIGKWHLCGFKQTKKICWVCLKMEYTPDWQPVSCCFFFGSASWWKLEIPPFHDNGGHYPLVMTHIAIENGPVEIVKIYPALKWWIFPVRYVATFTRPGIKTGLHKCHICCGFSDQVGQSLLIPPKLRTCAWKWGTKESHNCHGSETGDFYPFLSIFGYP